MSNWYDESLGPDDTEAGNDEAFDWDEGNFYKLDDHRVTADEVEEACRDPYRKPAEAYRLRGERRRALVGATESERLLYVVYTQRLGRIRVISARDATGDERRKYWR